MRKVLIAALAASALVPTMASAQSDREVRQGQQEVQRDRTDAPRGQRYRPIAVGYRFQPAFYSNRYWVNDYGTYRLPAPGYNRRWVRYGNDVVLVDLRSGAVVRVLNNFFW